MKVRRQISGTLHNFLETFTSRYSDYDGYWLFGMLIQGIDRISIDLLSKPPVDQSKSLKSAATEEAITKFCEQMSKADIPSSCVCSAILDIVKSSAQKGGHAQGGSRDGFDVLFRVSAVSDLGKRYEFEKSVFVAPHDPKIESRSTRRLSKLEAT